jgi:glycyl-tRNA synthetase
MSSGRARLKWHLSLGLGKENYRFHDHEKLAHYAMQQLT